MLARQSVTEVGGLSRLASVGALGVGVAVPVVTLLAFATVAPLTGHWGAALVATCLYLPLHLRHIAHGLRGQPPRGLPWTLLAVAGIIIGFTPLLGAYWLDAYGAVAASVLVTTTPRFSFPLLAFTLVAVALWAAYLAPDVGNAQYVYLPAAVLDRAMMVFIPVWLVGALRRMQAARQALADEAVELERRQVDSELEKTVGIELGDVIHRTQRALEAMSRGAPAAAVELQGLVDGSRHALADARRVIGRYKVISSDLELDKATSLLRAAGIDIALELPRDGLPPTLDASFRSSLRASVADLLHEQPAGQVVLRVARTEDRCSLMVGAAASKDSVA